MSALVSIIIPVFNVKNYLERCVHSVINQTYFNLDIILVDDGSTDGSEKICDELARSDIRIRVIHKRNGGLSSARNAGIQIARGEFIGFIDSDDYVKEDMYKTMLEFIRDDVDIVTCGTAIVYDKKDYKRSFVYCNPKQVMYFSSMEAIKEMLLINNLCFSACDKLFRKELFKNIEFPIGRLCEDLPTIYKVVKKSRKIVNIGDVKYLYYYRNNSISRSEFKLRRMDYVLFARDILLDIKNNFPDLYLEAEAMYIKNICVIINEIDNSSQSNKYKKVRKRLCEALRHMYFLIIMNPYILEERMIEINNIVFARVNR